ncbi:MAG: hypothetical protein EZS28_028128, partial [Streblomastix strix]
QYLLAIPGVPLLHMNMNVIVFEPPSKRSIEFSQMKSNQQQRRIVQSASNSIVGMSEILSKVQMNQVDSNSTNELSRFNSMPTPAEETAQQKRIQKRKKKELGVGEVIMTRKHAKGPNPLSIKKKQEKIRLQQPKQQKRNEAKKAQIQIKKVNQ